MAVHRTQLSLSILFLSLLVAALADDAAVMNQLATDLTPVPSDWSKSTYYCNWSGIRCVNSNRVVSINLASKSLSGSLPSNLNTLTQLKTLSLQQNQLSGTLPSLANLTFLQDVYLDNNNFSQIASGAFLGLTSLQTLNLSANINLDPWIVPSDLIQSSSLATLYASNANLVGSLPDFFGSFPNLQNLRLSYNNLTGSIPDVLTHLSQLQVFDVSNNNLTGKMPVFPSKVKFTTTGNPFLGTDTPSGSGGTGGTPASGTNATAPAGSTSGTSNSSISGGIIAVVAAIVIFFGFVLVVSFKSPSEIQRQSSGDDSDIQASNGGNVVISIQVLRQATNNFSEANILGRGGFGVVYVGELSDGRKIAVKKSTARDTKGFKAEIAVLTKARHRHVVALLGYCINGDERLLVYEYMPQGTLGQHLFDWQKHGYRCLTWKQRVTIALDVARGVEYLHSLGRESYIHRDLKPSNILLGDDMRAKVADFGFAKKAPEGNYSVETELKGTFGYIAPEYAASGQVTTKVDVYAFGVVLMELLTGRKAVDGNMPAERSNLVTWFRNNKDNIPGAIDKSLDSDKKNFESICKVAKLARHCTAREPSRRPNIGKAVYILLPLVEQWKPTCLEEEQSSGFYHHMSLPQVLRRWQAGGGTSTTGVI